MVEVSYNMHSFMTILKSRKHTSLYLPTSIVITTFAAKRRISLSPLIIYLKVLLRPVSKVVIKFLRCMQKHGYISDFEVVDDARAGKIVVELNGRLNKCGVISPRFDLKLKNFEKFVPAILPSRQFGFVILTTNKGIMDHNEARKNHIGGKVLGFFY